jgi:hypothetical protein
LNDNFSTDPANPSGGWVVSSGRDNVFPPGGPIFGVAEIDVAPEPAAALLQALALLGLAAFARYRNRSRAQTRNMSMRNS